MTECGIDDVANVGAYWITIGQLAQGMYSGSSYVDGTPSQRRGAVRAIRDVAAHESSQRKGCFVLLAPFFNDADEGVREEAASALTYHELLKDEGAPALVMPFVHGLAFETAGDRFLHELENLDASLEPFSDALLAIAQRFQEDLRQTVQNSGSRLFLAGDSLATVVFRLYQQTDRHGRPESHSRSLDALDALLRANVGQLRELVKQIDA